MKDRITPLNFVMGSFAVFRLAGLIVCDNGPRNVFNKVRKFTLKKRVEENKKILDTSDQEVDTGRWANVNEGINCPYCVGMWMSFLISAILFLLPRKLAMIIVFPFAIAGLQNAVERLAQGVEKMQD